MSLVNYFYFILFCSLIVFSPGPMTLLLMGLGIEKGFTRALPAQLGASTAYLISLGIFAVGLTAFLQRHDIILKAIQWIGVIYLLYLALKQWQSSKGTTQLVLESSPIESQGTSRDIFVRGFITGISNPKAFIIFGAIIPQFAVYPESKIQDVSILSGTYLIIQILCGLTYIYFGNRLRTHFKSNENTKRMRQVMSGVLILVAGLIAFK